MHKQILVAAMVMAMGLGFVQAQEPSAPAVCAMVQPRTITATGTAKVYVKPDEAILTVGVREESRSLKEAKEEVDKVGRDILGAIRKAKIDEKDTACRFT